MTITSISSPKFHRFSMNKHTKQTCDVSRFQIQPRPSFPDTSNTYFAKTILCVSSPVICWKLSKEMRFYVVASIATVACVGADFFVHEQKRRCLSTKLTKACEKLAQSSEKRLKDLSRPLSKSLVFAVQACMKRVSLSSSRYKMTVRIKQS